MSRPTVKVASKKRQKLEADRLFSLKVRARGICEAAGFDDIGCSGNHQCAHLVPRRYLSVRWRLGNAACLCAAHHLYLTHFPLAHERFCRGLLGDDMWEQLKYTAENHRGAPDYDEVLERLRAGA